MMDDDAMRQNIIEVELTLYSRPCYVVCYFKCLTQTALLQVICTENNASVCRYIIDDHNRCQLLRYEALSTVVFRTSP